MRYLVATLVAFLVLAGTARADAGPGDTGQEVVQVQMYLRSFGYSVKVDGTYGPQTTRAVQHFQRANKLLADGEAGPITMAAFAGKPATRIDPPTAVPSIPDFGGDLCDEMSWYRQQAGLPEQFDAIGWRESKCQNDARPTNAVARSYRGWWSVGVMHIRNKVYGPGAAACGITSEWDYYGTSPEQKKASACFAKVLYDISGMQPWRL